MEIIELILDENEDNFVEAISVVEYPAIEEDFVALKSQNFKFEKQDNDKKLLIGPILIPNKPIYRKSGDKEYYIYFSRETTRKASQLYLKQGMQKNATLEHEMEINGLTLVESWIIDDKENDKSNMFGMDLPLGTWVGSIKVDNEKIWNDYVKTGKVKGFSIEGYFADKVNPKTDDQELDIDLLSEIGFVIEPFGAGMVIVREIPALIGHADIKQIIIDLGDDLSSAGLPSSYLAKVDLILGNIACHRSVRSGRVLNETEMNNLLREMEITPNSGQCNHGRPTSISLSLKDIEKLFNRI